MLEDKPNNMPWFLQVNFPGPHPPFSITKLMNESVNDLNRSLIPYPYNCSFDEDAMKISRLDYIAEIENIDILMGDILGKLLFNSGYFNMSGFLSF